MLLELGFRCRAFTALMAFIPTVRRLGAVRAPGVAGTSPTGVLDPDVDVAEPDLDGPIPAPAALCNSPACDALLFGWGAPFDAPSGGWPIEPGRAGVLDRLADCIPGGRVAPVGVPVLEAGCATFEVADLGSYSSLAGSQSECGYRQNACRSIGCWRSC